MREIKIYEHMDRLCTGQTERHFYLFQDGSGYKRYVREWGYPGDQEMQTVLELLATALAGARPFANFPLDFDPTVECPELELYLTLETHALPGS